MAYLAPSILAADFTNLTQQIRAVELGKADFIHCDIMDGKFVPNLTFGPIVVSAVKRITKLPLDVHLMINEAEKLIPDFVKAGANNLIVHQENNSDLRSLLNYIKSFNINAGIAINPDTSVDTILPYLELADLILVMSVNPGFGGQKFTESTLEKTKFLNEIKKEKGYNFNIGMDGGIYKDNIQKVINAGCDIVVTGTAVFHSENITASTVELKNLIKS